VTSRREQIGLCVRVYGVSRFAVGIEPVGEPVATERFTRRNAEALAWDRAAELARQWGEAYLVRVEPIYD
jgi:hypothetical protein